MIKDISTPLAIGQSSNYYTLKAVSGFGSAAVDVVKWQRPGFHGIKTPRAFWRERIIRMIIGVRADSSATYEQKRRDLQAAFDLPRDGLTWLKFETVAGLLLQTQVQLNAPIQAPLKSGEVTIGEFRIELIAEDPVLYSQTENTEDIALSGGPGTIGSGVIANAGNCSVFPTNVRIYGSVTDPYIKHMGLDRVVAFTGYTLPAGHYIDIDMLNETVLYDGVTNYWEHLTSDDFWYLTEGNNTINIAGTVGGSGDRKLSVSSRGGYLGV